MHTIARTDFDKHSDYLYALIKSIESGNQLALEQLFRLYYDRLFYFAFSFLHARELSEEVVADVFFNIWKNRKHLSGINNIDTYLYKSIKNRSLNELNKKDLKQASVSLEEVFSMGEPIDASDPESKMITMEEVKKIQAAIDSLPEQCRLVFKLTREDRLKYKEVAQILGISVKTIDAHLAKALKKISQALKQNKIFLLF
jgi:RNA polymerase sigma-70 factor (family 1)